MTVPSPSHRSTWSEQDVLRATPATVHLLQAQMRFWVAFHYEMHLCNVNSAFLAPHVQPFTVQHETAEATSISSLETLCAELGIGAYNDYRKKHDGGLFFQAKRHARFGQLVQILRAVDDLLTLPYEPRRLLERLKVMEHTATIVRELEHMIHAFYHHIMGYAVASLWLWKERERSLPRYEQQSTIIVQLWLATLKLRMLMMDALSEQLMANTAETYVSVVPPFKSTASETMPILAYPLSDLWLAIRQLSWCTSGLLPGRMTFEYADLLWARLALMVSTAGSAAVYDHPAFVEEVPQQTAATSVALYRVNTDLLVETERIFYYYYNAQWLYQCLTAHRAAPAPAKVTMERRWLEMVQETLTSDMSEFVRLDFESRIWSDNMQWDDVENYELRTRTIQCEPRTAIMRLHPENFDIVTTIAVSPLTTLWMRAVYVGEQYRTMWLEADHAIHEGMYCKTAWDMAIDHEQENATFENSLPYRTELDEKGRRYFVSKETHSRLRGQDEEMAHLIYTRNRAIAAKTEFDTIQESVLHTLLSRSRSEYQVKMKNDTQELRHWPFIFDVCKARYSLLQLSHAMDMLSQLTPLEPLIVRVFNCYIVHDGKHCLVSSPFLEDALAAYVESIEGAIRRHMSDYARVTKHVSPFEAGQVIRTIQKLLMYIPPMVRMAFRVMRDPITGLEIADQYVFNERQPCLWNEHELRTTSLWPMLIKGTSQNINPRESESSHVQILSW